MSEQITPIQYKPCSTIPFIVIGFLVLVLICIFMIKYENITPFLEHPHFSLTSIEMSPVKEMNSRSESGSYRKSKIINGMPERTVSSVLYKEYPF